MKKTIAIPQGNEFSIFVPFVVFSGAGSSNADAALWNNVTTKVYRSNTTTEIEHTTALQEQYVVLSFADTLALGSYDVIISGEYETRNVSAPLNNLFAITRWADGNYADFVVGQPIICPTQTIIGQFNTTQDIEELERELRDALAAAEAAKAEYEEKVEELDGVAQQGTNPDATNTAILTAIGNISIDTTTIAKQGTNASATLTATQTAATNAYASAEAAKTATIDGNDTAVSVAKEIRSEVGTGSDTAAETGTLFAVVKWVKDKVKSIFNLIGSPASGQPATLFAAIAAGGGGGGGDAQESTSQAILAKVQQIIDANIITPEYDGVYFIDGYTPVMPFDIITHLQYITKIIDNKSLSIISSAFGNMNSSFPNNGGAESFSHLQEVRFNKATTSSARIFMRTCNTVKRVYLPEMTSMNFYESFHSCSSLLEVHIPKLLSVNQMSNTFYSCNSLILIEAGVGITSSFSFLSTWNPTIALSSSISSLVEQGETFANNLEKLLYNIRTYIAANLTDRTGQSALTITFSANVKSAINADTTTAQAFTSKNWTIA